MPKQAKKKRIKNLAAYELFVVWCATPAVDRKPATQELLAEELNVDGATLSDWKKVEGFWDEVEKQIKKWMKDKTSNVIGSLYHGILKDKKAAEVKLWLQYALGFTEKSGLDDETMEGVSKLQQTLRDIFEKKRQA